MSDESQGKKLRELLSLPRSYFIAYENGELGKHGKVQNFIRDLNFDYLAVMHEFKDKKK